MHSTSAYFFIDSAMQVNISDLEHACPRMLCKLKQAVNNECVRKHAYAKCCRLPCQEIRELPHLADCGAVCSFMDNASCRGCCCRRSTTSFQSSRSCLTRSSCDSMCCCEIWSSRRTLWSAFFAIMSRMFR